MSEGSGPDEGLAALGEAVRISPKNLPLRRHYAEALLKSGRAEEAEREFREALALAADDSTLKFGLAQAFYRQGKHKQALVTVEDLTQLQEAPPRAFLLYAHLLFRAGELEQAASAYRSAVEGDASLVDNELEARLGIVSKPAWKRCEDEDEPVPLATEGEPESVAGWLEHPGITFKDVGGMDAIKEEVRLKIIYPLTHPEMYRAYGKAIGGGILLYGPPGCGKTYLARATAGEIHAAFLSVGISDVLDMWMGQSERNLHELFEQARAKKPCVVFFDEVDALGANRSDMRRHAGRQLINQFLAEMDGVQQGNEGLLVLGATNAPWHLDGAFRRPGRFDRILFVPPPDAVVRAEILRLHLKGKPMEDIGLEVIGQKLEGYSGADLRAVVDAAVEGKIRQAMKAGAPSPLTAKDLLAAAASIKPTTREWFATARNYALYANQGGLYDDVLAYLNVKK